MGRGPRDTIASVVAAALVCAGAIQAPQAVAASGAAALRGAVQAHHARPHGHLHRRHGRRRRHAHVVCFQRRRTGRWVCRGRRAGRPIPARARDVQYTWCADAQLAPAPGNGPQLQAAAMCLVNQIRVRHDLPPLRPDAALGQAAQRHDDDMVWRGYFDHVSPAGDTPLSRIRDAGYLSDTSVGWVVGENIASGTLTLSTPAAIVSAWETSPEHLANILDPAFTDTAIRADPEAPPALAKGQPGATYTEEFGGRDRSG